MESEHIYYKNVKWKNTGTTLIWFCFLKFIYVNFYVFIYLKVEVIEIIKTCLQLYETGLNQVKELGQELLPGLKYRWYWSRNIFHLLFLRSINTDLNRNWRDPSAKWCLHRILASELVVSWSICNNNSPVIQFLIVWPNLLLIKILQYPHFLGIHEEQNVNLQTTQQQFSNLFCHFVNMKDKNPC